MPSSSQAPSYRAGVLSGQSSWKRQIEVPLELLNHLFEARRGHRAFDDVGQADATAGGHVESDGSRPQLPVVLASRSWLDPAGNDPNSQGMASSETELWSHLFAQASQLPEGDRTIDTTPDQAEVRQSGGSLVQALRQKGILSAENAWRYLAWDNAAKCLRPTKQPPIPHEKVQELTIQLSQLTSQGDLIQRFSALKPMNRDQVPEDSQVTIPWRLDLSLRSAASTQLFEILNTLSGSGICQLILLRLRPTGLQRSPLATAIAHRVRR